MRIVQRGGHRTLSPPWRGVSAVAVLHSRRCCLHAVFPFIVGRLVLPSVYTAWTIAGSAVLGQVVLARRCTTPGAVYVRAVRSVARGDTIGAVLGRGLGHYDRCRGLDSVQLHVLFKVVDFLIVALRQFPVVLVRLPSCFSLVVDVPVVLLQQVVPCQW